MRHPVYAGMARCMSFIRRDDYPRKNPPYGPGSIYLVSLSRRYFTRISMVIRCVRSSNFAFSHFAGPNVPRTLFENPYGSSGIVISQGVFDVLALLALGFR